MNMNNNNLYPYNYANAEIKFNVSHAYISNLLSKNNYKLSRRII